MVYFLHLFPITEVRKLLTSLKIWQSCRRVCLVFTAHSIR